MLEPLSKTKRLLLLSFFTLLFLLLIPLVLFHSLGYRFGDDGDVVQTGGVYFNLDDRDSEIYIDGIRTREQGFLSSGLFIADLDQKDYALEVRKEGKTIWKKQIGVIASKVEEVHPYHIANFATTTEILPKIVDPYTKKTVVNKTHMDAVKLFTATTTTKQIVIDPKQASGATTTIATTSQNKNNELLPAINKRGLVAKDHIDLYFGTTTLYAEWNSADSSVPFYFCEQINSKTSCTRRVAIEINQPISQVNFLPHRRDIVVYATNQGVFITELDQRGGANTHQIFKALSMSNKSVKSQPIEFRFDSDGNVLVKEKDTYYIVEI